MLYHHVAERDSGILLTWQEESTLNFPLPHHWILLTREEHQARTVLAKLEPIPNQESALVQVPISVILDQKVTFLNFRWGSFLSSLPHSVVKTFEN